MFTICEYKTNILRYSFSSTLNWHTGKGFIKNNTNVSLAQISDEKKKDFVYSVSKIGNYKR